ncbi:MAG: glycosyltransferase family 4 protein [Limnoraphis sp. WC205]|nr:glycosyltransferase family 4 protein [Limnoraphis sp. WC205]
MFNQKLNSSIGINIVGHVTGDFGLGEGVRGTLRALEADRIPFAIQDIKEDSQQNLDSTYEDFSEERPYPVNIVHTIPHPLFLQRIGTEYFKDRYNIGFWICELLKFPVEWQSAFDFFNEIWTYSNYTAEAISAVSPIPVFKVAPSIHLPPNSLDRKDLGLPKDKFIFLFIFDFASIFERKNPLGTIEAFKRAFGKSNSDVLLILKFRLHPQFVHLRDRLKACTEGWRSIRLIEANMTKKEVNALIDNCDCYVSLHRAEGFGLTMAEAMFYGKPVIATAYSANLDFMNVCNSFLVKYHLVTNIKAIGPYPAGSVWANPDIDHAASLMHYVFNNYTEAKQIGARAADEIRYLLSPKAIGKQMRKRLNYINSKINDSKDLKTIYDLCVERDNFEGRVQIYKQKAKQVHKELEKFQS